MKGRNVRPGLEALRQQPGHALLHLVGGFVRERHRQDFFRPDAASGNQIGDAKSDDARLAAARAGQYQHRAFQVLNGFALLRIELIEQVGHPREALVRRTHYTRRLRCCTGEVVLAPEIVRRIEALLETTTCPSRRVPLHRYA